HDDRHVLGARRGLLRLAGIEVRLRRGDVVVAERRPRVEPRRVHDRDDAPLGRLRLRGADLQPRGHDAGDEEDRGRQEQREHERLAPHGGEVLALRDDQDLVHGQAHRAPPSDTGSSTVGGPLRPWSRPAPVCTTCTKMSSSGGTTGTNARTARPWSSRLFSTLEGGAAFSSATPQRPFSPTPPLTPAPPSPP